MSEIRIKTLVVGMVGTNCYLVYDNETKRAAVIDPGDGAGQIANMAVSLGLKPEAILLTHGHFDHMMADTLFAGSYGRTDFPTGSGRQIAESVRRLLSTLPDDTMVYPGHMDTTTIGFEKKYNPLSGAMG